MRVVLEGPPPAWIGTCSDEVLRARLGAGTYTRGVAYAHQRAVTTLTVSEGGRVLHATVRGSGRHDYSTVVHGPDAPGSGSWTGRCSCPVQVDCKHVAAALLTARRHLARPLSPARPPAPVHPWEAQLSGMVAAGTPEPTAAPLGLQVEVVVPDTRYSRGRTAPRLRLRPVTPGRAGRWVRTGASWRDIEGGYGPHTFRSDHRAVVRALLATFRARQPSYLSVYSEPAIHLDDLGPGGWRLLAEAREAGIALLTSRPDAQPVRLAPGPALVVLDLCHSGTQADARLAVTVRIPDEPDAPLPRVVLVGNPAHGLFVDSAERLLLAPFARPLDEATCRLLAQGGLEIPATDLPRFLTRYYPALQQRFPVESSDGSVELPEISPPRLALDVAFEPGHRTALRWAFAYAVGDELVRVGPDDSGDVVRDRAVEQALVAGLPDLPGVVTDVAGRRQLAPQTSLTGIDTATFAARTLPDLLERGDVVVRVSGTPPTYAETVEAPLVTVSVRDGEEVGTDWFDLLVDVSVGGETVPLSALIAGLARGEEHLILDSGTWFRLDRPELQALRRLVEEARSLQDRESPGLRLTAYQAGLWQELVGLGVVEHQSERWSRSVGSLLTLDQLPRPEPPLKLQATLRPYQLDGYRWLSLLWDHQLGGVLADDMGLGKTLQTLAMAARAYEQGTLGGEAGPLLVVAPTSVVATWAREAERFCPDLTVVAVTETERRSGRRLAELTAGADLVITSYALFRIDEDAYREPTWSGLVLDEAQFVKNAQAKTYSCARRLAAPRKLAITGTPLENSLMDLWSMLSITAPGLFPSPQRFSDTYRKPIESGRSPEQLATLRRRIRPLMLRRTKDQVAADLPPKVEQVVEVTLNPQHRRVYDKHLQRERQRVLGLLDDLQRNRIAILRSLTVLRQLSLAPSLVDPQEAGVRSSKIDVLVEQLREVVGEGHRVLVFSQFTGFLSLVRERLRQEGIGHCYLDGRTRDRQRRIAEFTGGDAPVFLISLKAGGVGLTLTEADYVFVLDPWWNPATEAQAIDRAHRIGQDKTVMVYRMVATDTIEQKVVGLQQRKRDLFSRVVDDGAVLSTALTADDIRGLFS